MTTDFLARLREYAAFLDARINSSHECAYLDSQKKLYELFHEIKPETIEELVHRAGFNGQRESTETNLLDYMTGAEMAFYRQTSSPQLLGDYEVVTFNGSLDTSSAAMHSIRWRNVIDAISNDTKIDLSALRPTRKGEEVIDTLKEYADQICSMSLIGNHKLPEHAVLAASK